MTNTNYHIAFDRMFARGASTEIDAAYSNPAGLAWGHEGFQLSLNFQKPWQHRDIDTSIPGYLGSNFEKKYNGVASAPIVPALFAAYKKEMWAFSAIATPSLGCAVRIATETRGSVRSWGLSPIWFSLK